MSLNLTHLNEMGENVTPDDESTARRVAPRIEVEPGEEVSVITIDLDSLPPELLEDPCPDLDLDLSPEEVMGGVAVPLTAAEARHARIQERMGEDVRIQGHRANEIRAATMDGALLDATIGYWRGKKFSWKKLN